MTTKKKTRVTTQHPGATPADPLAARAQQATDLKYGPELTALQQLGQTARSDYLAGAGQARSAADSIVAATNESAGGLADFLARAGQRGQDTLTRVAPVAQGISNEGQLAARNHGLDVQSVAAQLANTKTRAQEAGAYQTARLYDQYRGDVGKINQQASGLANQAGSYAQQVYQSLLDDKSKSDLELKKISASARNAALQRGTSRLIAGVDVNGQVIPGSPKAQQLQTAADAVTETKKAAAAKAKKEREAKNKKPWLTSEQQNTFVAAIKTVASLVRDQEGKAAPSDITLPNGQVVKAGEPLTSSAIRALLVTKNNPLGRPFTPVQINAAFDLAKLNGLSTANVNALHAANVKVKGFFPTVSGGAKPPKKATIVKGPAGFPKIVSG